MSANRESKRPRQDAGPEGGDGVASPPLSPGLWLVATPIGNLGDITLRAIAVLRSADVLVCEDTRRTRMLMDLLDIAVGGRPVMSYNDRNGAQRRPQILRLLEDGRSVAYASDAGTPLIADPGYRLVEMARDAGVAVQTAPGPSAVIAALSLSGLPTDRFAFGGFLPTRSAARKRAAGDLAHFPGTVVYFESPRRLADSLTDLAETLGPTRPAAVARELTKTFEEVRHGTLEELAEAFRADPARGEIVLLIAPADAEDVARTARESLDGALSAALQTGSVKDASRDVAARLGLPKRDVYARALELSAGRKGYIEN